MAFPSNVRLEDNQIGQERKENSMRGSKRFWQIFWTILGFIFLVGCAAPAHTTAGSIPTPPGIPDTLPPPPTTPQPPPSPMATAEPTGVASLFKLIRTVEVVPDDLYKNGAFTRTYFVPQTGRMVVTFGGQLLEPAGGCTEAGHGYKEYTPEMEPTGKSGVLNCEMADLGSTMVDNFFYDVSMHGEGDSIGWRIMKYNAVSWEILADVYFPLDMPKEANADPMVAFVNGMLDVSSGYYETGEPSMGLGEGTHHQLFTPDLKFIEEKMLKDPPHIHGASMIYVDGVYYLITATAYDGDVIVMKYDKDWKYLGKQDLIRMAHFSTGVAFDGRRFYVAYTDTSQRTNPPDFFPVYLNIHLAVFDREWNLVGDLAVTDFAPADNQGPARPSVTLHENRVYVSYDLEAPKGDEELEGFAAGKAMVNVYELSQQPGG